MTARDRRALGAAGEELAAAWYAARGFDIVARNWRCRDGELDVVARRDGLVVFCEVKTRTTAAFGVPVEAVDVAKQRRLRVLGSRWLADTGTRAAAIRFDIASVLGGEVEMFEDVL